MTKSICIYCLILLTFSTVYSGSLKSPAEFENRSTETEAETKEISPVSYPFVLIIKGYQNFLGQVKGSYCPMFPSCSVYGLQAVEDHGLEGVLMALDRLHRCGHDLVVYEKVIVSDKIKNLDLVKEVKDK